MAKTQLALPHADLSIDGVISLPGERLELSGARGAQAHLWGSKHASSWAWAHCNDFCEMDGEPSRGSFVLAGVTYHDPDGELAYCYNSETASMRLHVYRRARRFGRWTYAKTLVARGSAHFEYAQRTPIAELELQTT